MYAFRNKHYASPDNHVMSTHNLIRQYSKGALRNPSKVHFGNKVHLSKPIRLLELAQNPLGIHLFNKYYKSRKFNNCIYGEIYNVLLVECIKNHIHRPG